MKKLLFILPSLLLSLNAKDLSFPLTKSLEKASYIYSPRENTCKPLKIAFNSKTTKDGITSFSKIVSSYNLKIKSSKDKTEVIIVSGKFKNISFLFFDSNVSCSNYKSKF